MSTKATTSNSNVYNPASMGVYNGLQSQIGGLLSQYMNNPLGFLKPQYELTGQAAMKAATAAGQNAFNTFTNNMAAGGWSGGQLPGFAAQQFGAAQRGTSALQANAFLQNQLAMQGAANQMRNIGLQGAMGYSPLATGSTSTKTTSGLGTWLPQVVGAGMNIATGGLGGMFGGMGSLGMAQNPVSGIWNNSLLNGLPLGGSPAQSAWSQMPF